MDHPICCDTQYVGPNTPIVQCNILHGSYAIEDWLSEGKAPYEEPMEI
jgi:hypothetical protein